MKRRHSRKQIENAYAEIILRLAIAAECKDGETGRHIIHVSDYATAIARELRCSPKEVKIIRFASIMHDIGKISISGSILRKKKITDKEYGIIKEHTIVGSKIFSGSDSELLKAAAEIALNHHEWYDGSGYPFGIKGNRIPLRARIVALADSFDAIISKRAYKRAHTFEKSVEIIKKGKGTQFDPKVVNAFIEAIPSIQEIFRATRTIDDFLEKNRNLLNEKG